MNAKAARRPAPWARRLLAATCAAVLVTTASPTPRATEAGVAAGQAASAAGSDAPRAPRGLAVARTTPDSIELRWAAAPGVEGYDLFRNGCTTRCHSAIASFWRRRTST